MQIQHIHGWRHSHQGKPIDLVFSGSQAWENLKNPLLMIGGVHGDEPEGVDLALELLEWLKKRSPPTCPFALIPCLNPDGHIQNHRGNARGVDLNRNYPSSLWSPEFKEPRYNPGAHPNSELETQAVVELIETTKPYLIIHFHSWKPCVVCTGDIAWETAQKLASSSGYPVVRDIGYPTRGSLSEFGWKDKGIPVICTEEQEGLGGHGTWKRFGPALQEILQPLRVKDTL